MVPHDQQVAVSPPVTIDEELVLDSAFAINTLATSAHIFAWARAARTAAPWRETLAGEGARTMPSARERRTTAAGLRRIRVHEHEALLHERLLVIQGHAV